MKYLNLYHFCCESFWSRGSSLTQCFNEQRMLAQIQQPYKDVPSSASAVSMPGAFQTLNGCQGKAGNLSYILEIRNSRHLGYTRLQSTAVTAVSCVRLLIALSPIVNFILSEKHVQAGCVCIHVSHPSDSTWARICIHVIWIHQADEKVIMKAKELGSSELFTLKFWTLYAHTNICLFTFKQRNKVSACTPQMMRYIYFNHYMIRANNLCSPPSELPVILLSRSVWSHPDTLLLFAVHKQKKPG